jgi:hypothetical protein
VAIFKYRNLWKKVQTQKKHIRNAIFVFLGALIIALGFQNCSPTMNMGSPMPLTSTASSTSTSSGANAGPSWFTNATSSCSANPQYSYGQWSTCSNGIQNRTSLGCINTSGTLTQTVECRDSNGVKLADEKCDAAKKPKTSVTCESKCSGTPVSSQSCAGAVSYSWVASSFSSCSAQPAFSYSAWSTCSASGTQTRSNLGCVNTTGTQTRTVECQTASGSKVADSYCLASTKPPLSQSCSSTCSGTPVTQQSCMVSYAQIAPALSVIQISVNAGDKLSSQFMVGLKRISAGLIDLKLKANPAIDISADVPLAVTDSQIAADGSFQVPVNLSNVPTNFGSNTTKDYQLTFEQHGVSVLVTLRVSVTVLHASCGSANGLPSLGTPTIGLCGIGTPSAVTGNGMSNSPYQWSCSLNSEVVQCNSVPCRKVSVQVGAIDPQTCVRTLSSFSQVNFDVDYPINTQPYQVQIPFPSAPSSYTDLAAKINESIANKGLSQYLEASLGSSFSFYPTGGSCGIQQGTKVIVSRKDVSPADSKPGVFLNGGYILANTTSSNSLSQYTNMMCEP